MSYDMLGKLIKKIIGLPIEMIGTLYDLAEKLCGEEGGIWWAALKRFLRKENPWEKPLFKQDKTQDGWTLIEPGPEFDGKQFIPEIVEFLKLGESSVNGEEMRRRAKKLNAHLGQHHLEYLLEHQELIPEECRGKCLVFPGTVWQVSDGSRRVPYLYWDGGRWRLYFYWLGDGWDSFVRLVRQRG